MQAKHNSYVVSEKMTAFSEPPYIHATCVVSNLAFKFSIRADFFFLYFPQKSIQRRDERIAIYTQ